MSHFTKGTLELLRPIYYVPETDKKLNTTVQMISTYKHEKGGLSGHFFAVIQAVCSIARAFFISLPCYFAVGSKNLLLNCIHLSSNRMVLGHYKAALQSLVYSVIATLYVTIGTFIPPALNGFRMKVLRPSPTSPNLTDTSIASTRDKTHAFVSSPNPDCSYLSEQRQSLETKEIENDKRAQDTGVFFGSELPEQSTSIPLSSSNSSPERVEDSIGSDESRTTQQVTRGGSLTEHLESMNGGDIGATATKTTAVVLSQHRLSEHTGNDRDHSPPSVTSSFTSTKRNGFHSTLDQGERGSSLRSRVTTTSRVEKNLDYEQAKDCRAILAEDLKRMESRALELLPLAKSSPEIARQIESYCQAADEVGRRIVQNGVQRFAVEINLSGRSFRLSFNFQDPSSYSFTKRLFEEALGFLEKLVEDFDFQSNQAPTFEDSMQRIQPHLERSYPEQDEDMHSGLYSQRGSYYSLQPSASQLNNGQTTGPLASLSSYIKIGDSLAFSDEEDWHVVAQPSVPLDPIALETVGVRSSEMIGNYGVNLERQAHRVALDEYARVLKDDFGIDLDSKIDAVNRWLDNGLNDNPMVWALYRTLVYLRYPVDPWARRNGTLPVYTDAKGQYEVFVNSLREVMETEEYRRARGDRDAFGVPRECLDLVRALCEVRFRPENHALLRDLLQLHEDQYDRLNPNNVEAIPEVTRQNFAQVVMAKNAKVTGAPASMKVSSTQRSSRMLWGAVGLEDFLMTDLPFLRGKQIFRNAEGEERTFYYMRHPTPHVPGSKAWIGLGALARTTGLGHIESGEAIAPEFEGMLEGAKARKEGYLIQSHQRLNDSGKVENEDGRSQTLYRLQGNHDNFHVVFQAVEGDLFDHKGRYAKITTFTDLKKAIKTSFYDEKSPNRLPRALQENQRYREVVIDELLDSVHQTLFQGREEIKFDGMSPTRPGTGYANREWQAFILAFYILQGDDLKFRLPNVKYFSTHCKNFFDRGGDRAMAEDRMHQEMSGEEVRREQLEETIGNLVPVPLQSKGKGVIEKRLLPGLALAEILAGLPVEQCRRLQAINFSGYKPSRFEVSKRAERQNAVPLIKDAHTPQEIQEVFKALQGKSHTLTDNTIVQRNWDVYKGRESAASLFKQVDKDLGRVTVYVDGYHYNGTTGWMGYKYNAEGIYELLTESHKMSPENALKALAQIQQGICADPLIGLGSAFNHDELQLKVAHVAEGAVISVKTTGDNIEIKAEKGFQYIADDTESGHYREMPFARFNTTVSVAIPKNGGDPTGQWTWEVTEIPA